MAGQGGMQIVHEPAQAVDVGQAAFESSLAFAKLLFGLGLGWLFPPLPVLCARVVSAGLLICCSLSAFGVPTSAAAPWRLPAATPSVARGLFWSFSHAGRRRNGSGVRANRAPRLPDLLLIIIILVLVLLLLLFYLVPVDVFIATIILFSRGGVLVLVLVGLCASTSTRGPAAARTSQLLRTYGETRILGVAAAPWASRRIYPVARMLTRRREGRLGKFTAAGKVVLPAAATARI
jgi:hypothetical protein